MPSRAARRSWTPPAGFARIACLLSIALLAWPRPATATFHLVEINKVMAGYEGDATVQAVELRMLAAGENFVNTASIKVYDAGGNPVSILGTFAADLPSAGSVAGAKILCATNAFATRFGITPDLVIAPGIPETTGQVSFEKSICFVNAVAYGAVTTFKNGASAAPPLPTSGAPVLVRTVNDATVPSCPLGEDAAARFQLTTGSPSSPVIFTNYAGQSVSISSTVTAVAASTAPAAFRMGPNPFRSSAVIEGARARRITIFDIRGRMVRELLAPSGGAFANAVEWRGDDGRGSPVPSGIYFVRFEGDDGVQIRRLAVIR